MPAIILTAAIVALGSYWYFSPYVTMRALQTAAKQRDAEAFNARVDYPRLRESIKGQSAAKLTGGQPGDRSEAAHTGLASARDGLGALGSMLGAVVVNQVVDTFVRPEMLMRVMSLGSTEPGKPLNNGAKENAESVRWTTERVGLNKVVAYRQAESGDDSGLHADPQKGKGPALVFERSGFADWKLTGLQLP
jgi:hypothetical protein